MNVECDTRAGVRIIRVKNNLGLHDDIHELKDLVSAASAEGVTGIAVSFTLSSYLSSRSISILVQCFEVLKDRGGRLSIIAPNDDIRRALNTIGIAGNVHVYESEADIAR